MDKKSFICELCDKKLSSKQNLQYHFVNCRPSPGYILTIKAENKLLKLENEKLKEK